VRALSSPGAKMVKTIPRPTKMINAMIIGDNMALQNKVVSGLPYEKMKGTARALFEFLVQKPLLVAAVKGLF